jgi:hypothetical protein
VENHEVIPLLFDLLGYFHWKLLDSAALYRLQQRNDYQNQTYQSHLHQI